VTLDAEIRHGYCFRDVRGLAQRAVYRSYGKHWDDIQDQFDLAVSVISESLWMAEGRPSEQDLVTIGIRAVNRNAQTRMRQRGVSYNKPIASGQEPNMPKFWAYWWPYISYTGSHENGIVETIAMFQILPRLKPLHRDVILALAMHGTYEEAAASLGNARRTFENKLSAARKEFLQLWHEGEQPSRLWGNYSGGIEGERGASVHTLLQARKYSKNTRMKNGKS
jgi:DNA-directed RNA polymerase specialized sigma24 family protein